RGRIEPGRLVAPARIVGMLADRHEFDVGEAEIDHIRDQPVGKRVPGEEPAMLVAVPRTGMDLVDAHRHPARIGRGPARAMILVAPDVGGGGGGDRG
nr:hypothetical protein [Tanacetum cinerariifolium]